MLRGRSAPAFVMKTDTELKNDKGVSFRLPNVCSGLARIMHNQVVVQIFRYFWVSLLAAIADFSLFIILFELFSVWYIVANTAGFALGVYINYALSTKFVFNGHSRNNLWEFVAFSIIGIIGLLISNMTLYITIDIMGLGGALSKVIAICSAFFWNFFARKLLLFNK